MRVNVLEYDPAWAKSFQRIRETLLAALADVPIVSIEHVGSTAIPGLAAKPIIDIDIIVEPAHLPQAAAALSFNGYTYNPEPRGIDRMSFRYNAHKHDAGAVQPTEDGDIRRAVYLNIPTSVALRNHLAVKEVLMLHPDLVEEYSELKRGLAKEEHHNIGYYGLKKNDILRKILAQSSLDTEALNAVAKVNVMPPLKK